MTTPDDLHVFISWSGARSLAMARALHDWLSLVLQRSKLWMSTEIPSGATWRGEVASKLDGTDYGILCVTPENQAAPWLLFEAGALSKKFDRARVCPLLHPNMTFNDLKEPLTAFNGRTLNKDGVFALAKDLNALLGERGRTPEQLKEITDLCWPKLEASIAAIPSTATVTPKRTDSDKIDELLSLVRSMSAQSARTNAPGVLAEILDEARKRTAMDPTAFELSNLLIYPQIATPEHRELLHDIARALEHYDQSKESQPEGPGRRLRRRARPIEPVE